MVSPIVEDIYPRVPMDLDADQVLDWLAGTGTKYEKPKTKKLKEMAQEIGNAHSLFKQIPRANTLSEINELGEDIEILEVDLPKFDLNVDFRNRQREIAGNIFREVGAKGDSLNRIVDILEDNNYNLNKFIQHSYIGAKGERRLGIWKRGEGGFITHFKTDETILEIPEREPPFSLDEFGGVKIE